MIMIRRHRCGRPRFPYSTPIVIGLLVLSAPAPVFAQDRREGASAALEEVIVTARRRAENIQDVPLAVTAFQGAALERRDIGDIAALGDLAPNVTLRPTASLSGSSNAAAFFIRGVGQTDFAVTTDPGVGTYIDGVYVARSIGGVLDTLDVASIEILRGPQGTLFGRNTIGGAINVRSRRPGDEFAADIVATLGSRDRRQFAGALDLPLSDTVSSRFSFISKNQDGYVKRLLALDNAGNPVPTGDKANAGTLRDTQGDNDSTTVRGALEWSPSEAFNLYLSLDSTRIREASAASTAAISSKGSVPASALKPINIPGLGLVAPGDPRLLTGDPDTSYATGPNGTILDVDGLTAIATWTIGGVEVQSISAKRRTEGAFNRDGDGTPFPIGEQTRRIDFEQWSQEIKLSGANDAGTLDWTAGLYYLDEEAGDRVFVSLGNLFGPPPSIDIDNFIDNESTAVYAQATFGLTERLSISGGVRWTNDDKTYTTSQVIPAVPLTVVDAGNSASFDALTGRLGFEFGVTERQMVYVSAARGFKSGGFTPRYVAPVAAPLPFDEESVDTVEMGTKWESAGGRSRINAAAFHSKYEDIQLVLFDTFGAPINQNGGDATIKGLELEVQFAISEIFSLAASLAWLDAEFDSVLPPTGRPFQPITINSAFPNAPDFQGAVSPQFEFPAGRGVIRMRADWIFSGDVHQTFENDPELFQDAYNLLDASIAYEDEDSGWVLTLGGHNLTDKRIIISGGIGRAPGFGDVNYNRPREWYASLRKRF